MTIDDLIEELENIRDRYEGGGEFDIKVALQPTYPMSGSLLNVCSDPSNSIVYLASSDNEDYLSNSESIWNDGEVYREEDR